MNVLVERPSPAIKTGDLCPDDSENCRFHPLWRYARLAPPENPLRAHPTARERPDSGDSDSKRRAIWGIPDKIEETSTTNRVVATCCNSAMVMRFDDAKHWVPVYRARFQGDVPPLQWRICTKFKPEHAVLPTDIPSSTMYPAGFMWKLLTSKLSMLLSR
jgi:hypothetical protein